MKGIVQGESRIPKRIIQSPWLTYKLSFDPKTGKYNKVPLGSSTDPATWKRFDDVSGNRGVVLTTNHKYPTTLLVLDFDGVVGTPQEPEVYRLRDYAWIEKSVSGKGYHAFFEVPTEELVGKSFKNRYETSELGKFELYYTGRFIAFTGDHQWQSTVSLRTLSEVEELVGFKLVEKSTVVHTGITPPMFSGARSYDGIDLTYTPTEDLSFDVFKWVAKVIGYVRDEEHLFELFHRTDLAEREDRKYAEDGGRKLRRTLPGILASLDIEEAQIKAGTRIPFEEEEDGEGIEEIVSESIKSEQDYRMRYARLLEQVFHCSGQVKRSLFDGVAYFPHNGKLENIESEDIIKKLRDEIRVLNKYLDKENKYRPTEVADAMTAYRFSLKEELLLEVEAWDGVDRIKHLSTLVNLADERVSHECFEYFLKDWMVKCVHKVMTGRGTNRMIVLQGGQGVGKDSFLSMLYGGWTESNWREIRTPGKFEGEDILMEQVHNVAVASLRELDAFDPVVLKRLVDNTRFSFRQKYAKNTTSYANRVSFVASCNPKNPFRDETGNRRFLFFRIQGRADTAYSSQNFPHLPVGIKRDFDDQDQGYKNQVLAQGFHLWRENGKLPLPENTKFEAVMQALLDEATPEDTSLDMVEQFDLFFKEVLREREQFCNFTRIIPRNEILENPKFEVFCKSVEMRRKDVEKELASSGRRSKETNPRLCSGKTFFHLPEEFTIENRENYKRWEDGKESGFKREEEFDVPF